MSNDRSYLSALQDYYARHHAMPSYSSIGGLLGLRSKSSVAALVARLKLAGYVESTPDTMVCCDTGEKLMVKEPLKEVMRLAIEYARVIRRPITD